MPFVVPDTASNRALAVALEFLAEDLGRVLTADQMRAIAEAAARLRDAPDNPHPYRN